MKFKVGDIVVQTDYKNDRYLIRIVDICDHYWKIIYLKSINNPTSYIDNTTVYTMYYHTFKNLTILTDELALELL